MIAWLKRNPATAVLVALATLLAVLVWRDQESVTTDEAAKRKADLFELWRPDAITRVEITTHGKTAVLSRPAVNTEADAGEHPFRVAIGGQDFATDRSAVDEYMGRLELARMLRKADGVDHAAAKLDAPRVIVDVTSGEKRQHLAIGGPAPSPTGALYAEVQGRGVFVITAQLAAALDVDVDTLRTRSFLPIATSDIASLSLDGAAGARHLTRAPWGGGRGAGFRFDAATPEGPVRADAVAVDRILLALEHMQADRHLSDDDAERALHTEATLRLVAKDGAVKPVVIELGGACPAHGDAGEAGEAVVAIRREPTREAACVPKDVLDALAVTKDALLDRHVIGAAIDEVSEIDLREGDRKLDMARTSGGWHLRAPTDRAIDAEIGRGVLETMHGVEGDLVTRDLGPVTPRASLRIVGVDVTAGDAGSGERTESIDVVADRTGALFARRAEDGATLALSAEAARDLLPTDLALRAHVVFDEPNKRFQSLRIEGPTGVQAFTRTAAGGWTASEPKVVGAGADASLANDVVDALGHLTALRWIAGSDNGSFGLDHPRLVIEATLTDEAGDGGAPQKLHIALGAATADGSFARREGDPAIFVAPKALEVAASRWLLDRSVLMVEPSEVTRVTLERGKRRVIFERSGSALRLVGDTSPEATTRAAGVRDAIADLIAEGAVSLGAPKKEEGLDKPTLDISIERSAGAKVHIVIGAGDSLRGTNIYYARRDGVDATYAIAQGKIRALLDAL